MSYESLSDKEKLTYSTVNRRYGMGPSESTHAPISSSAKKSGQVVFSGDPLTSDVPPRIIYVGSIDRMNEYLGIPDADADTHVIYPSPMSKGIKDKLACATSKDDLKKSLTDEELHEIKLAAEAFVMGNSGKVAAYEAVINALYFPKRMAYFSSDEPFVISTEIVLKGPDPVVWNYPSIVMKEGGSIHQQGNVPLSVTTSQTVSETNNGDFVITSVPADPTPLTAPAGNPGKLGDPSHVQGSVGECAKHTTGSCDWYCSQQPGRGGTGGTGGNGHKGNNGVVGTAMSGPNTWHAGDITGKLIITARGGNGGYGGAGGVGGNGGTGGPGGAADPQGKCSAPGPTGYTGHGGNGAIGGDAGNGGAGSTMTIYYTSLGGGIDISGVVQSQPGNAGTGGVGGTGQAGTGTNAGNGANGTRGSKPIINPIKQ